MKTGKILGIMTIFLLSVVALASFASAAVTINSVKIDHDELSDSSTNFIRQVERGDEIDVKIAVTSNTDVKDIQIEGALRGYDHDDHMEDITDVFDMKAGVTYVKKLNIPLRQRADQDRYKLRIQVEDRDSPTIEKTYELQLENKRKDVQIKDVVFSPENRIRSGRTLITLVRVRNYGMIDQEGVRIRVSIPELGGSAVANDFIDDLDEDLGDDDQMTSEEMFITIPRDAKSGTYDVKVEVFYDDGDKKTSKTFPIEVVAAEETTTPSQVSTQPQTVITVGPETQDVAIGTAGSVYAVSITNNAQESKVYTLSASTNQGLTAKISPSSTLVVGAGETEQVFVFVSASPAAQEGQNVFSLTVKSGDEILKQIPLKANVITGVGAAKSWDNVKRGLEVGLIVLVVILVIIFLIIGFNKLKGEEETEESSQTYY